MTRANTAKLSLIVDIVILSSHVIEIFDILNLFIWHMMLILYNKMEKIYQNVV